MSPPVRAIAAGDGDYLSMNFCWIREKTSEESSRSNTIPSRMMVTTIAEG